MSPLTNILLAVAGFSLQAAAQTPNQPKNFVISVGKNGALAFDPSDIKANVNDTLEFRFWARNHSVVQGNWNTPCQPFEDSDGKVGFYSGFVPQADETGPNKEKVFKVTLTDTDPKVFYCSQFNPNANPPVNHCKRGMVGVVNGLGTSTFERYTALAANINTTGNPQADVKGGSFEALQASTPTDGSGGSGGQPTDTPGGNGAGSLGVSLGALAAAGAFAVALAF